MKNRDFQYELIVKELTLDNGEKESEDLQHILAENNKLNKIYRKLYIFWMHYFPTKRSHNIVEKTEKKLDFTYQNNPQENAGLWYKITASFI